MDRPRTTEGVSCSTFANVAREVNRVQIEPTGCPPYFAEPAAYSDGNFKLDGRDVFKKTPYLLLNHSLIHTAP